jgi:transposase-like protein
MKKKQKKSGEAKSEVLRQIPKACIDETAAVEFIERQRWGKTPACPRCGDTDVDKMTDGNGGRNKRFLWRCHGCKRQFTVRIGTIFEDSRIPLRVWCWAFWSACASKKGVSALQISRECNITYKSALFLMHRIRYAMAEPKPKKKLKGTVEADETFCGGRPRRTQQEWKEHLDWTNHKNFTARSNKTPVVAVVQRDGDVRAKVTPDITAKSLKSVIFENVDLDSRLMTDDNKTYRPIGRKFPKGHFTVMHSLKQYAVGDVTTNTVESYFALLKRGLYGTFHAVSKKHLHRYVAEFSFRWNTRKLDDGERLTKAMQQADGKRLMYREPVSRSA